MTNFRVSKKELIKALTRENGVLLSTSWLLREPDFIELKGELLEGDTVEELQTEHWLGDAIGTVEKCNECTKSCPCHEVDKNEYHDKPCCYHQPCECICHKKEEGCPICGHTKAMGKVSRCTSDFHRETKKVKPPERLTGQARIDNGAAMAQMAKKINEIIDYLKDE